MNTLLLVVLSVFVTAAVTSGIFLASRRRATPVPADDATEHSAMLEGYQERLQHIPIWNDLFSQLQEQLAHSNTLADMAQGFKRIFTREDVQSTVILAIGPIRDFALLDTIGKNTPFIHLSTNSFILGFPDIDQDACKELAQELYQALQQHTGTPRRWWLLKELAPALQEQLLKKYHIAGQAMITPLRYNGTLYGFSCVAGPLFSGHSDVIRDTGDRIAITGDMISTWLRCIAPQILAGRTELPAVALPMDVLASLDTLEQTIASLQEEAESQSILDALADYSHFSMLNIAETSLLATQTCSALMRICQADFAMVLLPTPDGKFAPEAIEMTGWSWSHYRAMEGTTIPHPLLPADHVLKYWPDAFTRLTYDTGEMCHIVKQKEAFAQANVLSTLDLESVMVKPATLEQHCLALLVVGLKRPGGLPDKLVAVTSSVAAIVAMSLKTLRAINERKAATQALEEAWKVTSTLAKQSIDVLVNIANSHKLLFGGRPEDVAKWANTIVQRMNIPKTQVAQLRLAALTCDIGMVAIPSTLLRKDGGFTPQEWKVLHAHPQMSVEILKGFGIFKEAQEMILHHHEHWDGSGYPGQLKGGEIPIGARILAVADCYVNVQTKRSYRPALSAEEALTLIQQEAGKQFDPGVVKALLRALAAEEKEQIPA